MCSVSRVAKSHARRPLTPLPPMHLHPHCALHHGSTLARPCALLCMLQGLLCDGGPWAAAAGGRPRQALLQPGLGRGRRGPAGGGLPSPRPKPRPTGMLPPSPHPTSPTPPSPGVGRWARPTHAHPPSLWAPAAPCRSHQQHHHHLHLLPPLRRLLLSSSNSTGQHQQQHVQAAGCCPSCVSLRRARGCGLLMLAPPWTPRGCTRLHGACLAAWRACCVMSVCTGAGLMQEHQGEGGSSRCWPPTPCLRGLLRGW